MIEPLTVIQAIRESFIGAEKVYIDGSCYKFHLILKAIFPESEAYYNSNHVITEINGIYYDITGIVEPTPQHLKMSEHFKEEHYSIKHTIFDIYGKTK